MTNRELLENEEVLPSYLSRLVTVPLLTQRQEEDLTAKARAGDKEARQRLIEANMRLVINIARSYRSKNVPLEDLIQDGAIGLMQAVERFDPTRGFRFSTYATHWIKQAIGRSIDGRSKAIRVPAHISQAMRKIERARTALQNSLCREPSREEIAQAAGISVEKLSSIAAACQELISLDMTIGEAGTSTLGGLLQDNTTPDPETRLMSAEAREELREIFSLLSERERTVMEMRFHFENDPNPLARSHEEAAKNLNVTRERVRQIENQAIRKLRIIAQQRKLRELLPHIQSAM